MRKLVSLAALAALAGCGSSGFDRDRPDEFAVSRQAPLVVPPDYTLLPPQPGAARPQDTNASTQALDAMFGGPAPRSAVENATLGEAGRDQAEPGIRSGVGDPGTVMIDKGSVTRDIVAAPEGDGQSAKASAPQ